MDYAQNILRDKDAAKQGGAVAGNARKELESKTGQKVVSNQNYLPEKETRQINETQNNE